MSELSFEVDGHVATVVMNRPPHNFLSVEQIHAIGDVYDELDEHPDVRVIVLAAEGRSFCAGADFGGGGLGGGAGGDKDEMFRGPTHALYAGAARLYGARKPTIAAVQGPAVGGGLGLACSADWRVTCPEARFSANFVKLGIHQGFGVSVSLPELVGKQTAFEVLMWGRRYKGDEAVALGLADELVDDASQVRDRAQELAAEMARNAPLSLLSIKATLRQGLVEKIRAVTDHEADEQARLSATNDAAEGIRAVGERRDGNFTGT